MTEKYVQVPVSRIERARAVVESEVDETWVFRAQEALRALLSHPTPSAEPCTGGDGCTAPVHLHGCFADRGDCNSPDEHEPPRIADMVRGRPIVICTCGHAESEHWGHGRACTMVGCSCTHPVHKWFSDLSTIRDVVPPE